MLSSFESRICSQSSPMGGEGAWKRGGGSEGKAEESSLAALPFLICSSLYLGLNILTTYNDLDIATTSPFLMIFPFLFNARLALFPPVKIYSSSSGWWINRQKSTINNIQASQMEQDEVRFEDQLESLLPEQFILQSPHLQLLPSVSLIHEPSLSEDAPLKSAEGIAKTSSRDEKKRLAGARSRQKKKAYVEMLEERVKRLEGEVEECEGQIGRCKDQLFQAIQTSNQHSNQHAFTFAELEKHCCEEEPDIDRINLLLDIIQTRIGANAKERQANLDYSFKQMINSIFPAMHRYLMHSATFHYDLFDPEPHPSTPTPWTQELFSKLQLSASQLSFIKEGGSKMASKRREAVEFIRRLRRTKEEMKRQEQKFEQKISEFREDLTAVQSGRVTVFGEKNKLRRQFAIGETFGGQNSQKKIKFD